MRVKYILIKNLNNLSYAYLDIDIDKETLNPLIKIIEQKLNNYNIDHSISVESKKTKDAIIHSVEIHIQNCYINDDIYNTLIEIYNIFSSCYAPYLIIEG